MQVSHFATVANELFLLIASHRIQAEVQVASQAEILSTAPRPLNVLRTIGNITPLVNHKNPSEEM